MADSMVVVRRWVSVPAGRVIWVATDRARWHVWWGPDGGPYRHRWPADEDAARACVADLRHRAGCEWQDATSRPGPG